MFSLPLHIPTLSVSFCGALLVLQLGLLYAFIVCESNFLHSCALPITSHVIPSMLSSLMSGIPSSEQLSHGATKNLHLSLLSLCFNFTAHTPIYLTDCMFLT